MLTADDFVLLNPNTLTCPTFRGSKDAEITKAIYSRVPVFIRQNEPDGDPWNILFMAMFHMANSSGLFRTRNELEAGGWILTDGTFHQDGKQYFPLYEGKMLYQFDDRFGTYEGQNQAQANKGFLPQVTDFQHQEHGYRPLARYWVDETHVDQRLQGRWNREWLIGWRDVTNTVSERTMVSAVLPRTACNDKVLLMLPDVSGNLAACLSACLNSFTFDYCVRQKFSGSGLKYFIVRQVPVPSPSMFEVEAPWQSEETLATWISVRTIELIYTSHALRGFARDLGYDGRPFNWDRERRFRLRCELDAAFFHLYGIAREDVEYIMGTFPIVEKKDRAAHGEYRTSRVILEIYDAMACAAQSGQPYRTPLDPPPANLDTVEAAPATITPLRPHSSSQPERHEKAPPAALAAEEKHRYETRPEPETADPDRTEAEALVDAILDGADFSQLPPEHRGNIVERPPAENTFPTNREQPQPLNGSMDAAPVRPTTPEAPNLYDAALALQACLPAGQKVRKHELLTDAARELGYPKLTRKVKTALNKALNAEHNAGRLKTDWALVWKPKKK